MASKTYAGIPMEHLTEVEERAQAAMEARIPFDARHEVSADAKYIVKNLVLWFFVAPIALAVLAAIVINAAR